MKTDYTPVNQDFHDIFEAEMEKEFSKVFYFEKGTEIEEVKGKINMLECVENFEEYLVFDSGQKVRIDRIISINGIPGPAYDEYDAFSLACFDCNVPSD